MAGVNKMSQNNKETAEKIPQEKSLSIVHSSPGYLGIKLS
jgi:hypothetical protein